MRAKANRRDLDGLQTDLFAETLKAAAGPYALGDDRAKATVASLDSPSPIAGAHVVRLPERPKSRAAADIGEHEMARRLEATGRYRVLKQLQPRPVRPEAWPLPGSGMSLGLVVDTETTGLDHGRDEVIELGMVAFTFDDGGIRDVVGVFSGLEEPTVPIGPEITRLTGITPEMVAGQRIDRDVARRFVERVDLVIAHNAAFDRPFCERLVDGFVTTSWACSVKEVDWSGLGFEGTKLGYLVGQCGWFHTGHRATDDCHALLEVLARPLPDHDGTPFDRLLPASRRTRVRIWAEGSPFDRKDALKARGYRWSDGTAGRPKAWWTEIEEEAHEAELAYLYANVYGRTVALPSQRLTARERFRR